MADYLFNNDPLIFQRPDFSDVNNSPAKPNISQSRPGPQFGDAYDRFPADPRNRRQVGIIQRMRVDLDHADATASAEFDASQLAHGEAGTR